MTNTKEKTMNEITDYGKLANDISNWIKDYAKTNKLSSLVVGVSGGIDSATVSTLCAMTGLPTFAYGLPCNSHHENNKNSELQLSWLKKNFSNVKTEIRDLSDTYITFKNGLNLSDLAKANTKSRLRMVYLYAQAGTLNGLVVGTGNKVEDYGTGFFSKYGDGGVDISPIGDLTKTQVWGLGKYLEIPQQIIDAPPTDGLHDENHSDEHQIGASYPELEWAMEFREKCEQGYLHHVYPSEFETQNATKRKQEVLAIYDKFHTKNAHKMQIPPIFKVDKQKYLLKEQMIPNDDGSFSIV